MSDSQWEAVMRICTVVMAACTAISTAIIIWQQATGVPASWFTYVAAFFAGFGFGYAVRYLVARSGEREPEQGGAGAADPEWATDADIDAMFAGGLLAELVGIGDAEKRSEHVRERVAADGTNGVEGELAALERYGCVRVGYKGDVRQLGGDWIDITRKDYPKHEERERMDALRDERETA